MKKSPWWCVFKWKREKIRMTGTQTNCRPACISNRETLTSVRDFIKGQIGNLKRSHFLLLSLVEPVLNVFYFLNILSILAPLLLQHLFSFSKKQQVPLLPVIHIKWRFSHEENKLKKKHIKMLMCKTISSFSHVGLIKSGGERNQWWRNYSGPLLE